MLNRSFIVKLQRVKFTCRSVPSLLLPTGLCILQCSSLLLHPGPTYRSPTDQNHALPRTLKPRARPSQQNWTSHTFHWFEGFTNSWIKFYFFPIFFIKKNLTITLLNERGVAAFSRPLASCDVDPQSSLMTTGANTMCPSTVYFRMASMIEWGNSIWRSKRKIILCLSWKQKVREEQVRKCSPSGSPFIFKTHFNEVDATLQTVGTLEISTQPFVLVPDQPSTFYSWNKPFN